VNILLFHRNSFSLELLHDGRRHCLGNNTTASPTSLCLRRAEPGSATTPQRKERRVLFFRRNIFSSVLFTKKRGARQACPQPKPSKDSTIKRIMRISTSDCTLFFHECCVLQRFLFRFRIVHHHDGCFQTLPPCATYKKDAAGWGVCSFLLFFVASDGWYVVCSEPSYLGALAADAAGELEREERGERREERGERREERGERREERGERRGRKSQRYTRIDEGSKKEKRSGGKERERATTRREPSPVK
jgi:hypothetical protein